MPSVGERLRGEREARNTTIEELSVATGIYLGYLEALERNEFHALPGRAFGKLYIRAYAKILGFDPQSLIEDYDRELEVRRLAQSEPPPPEPTRARRAEAVIARWRQSAMAERNRANGRSVSAEVDPGRLVEAPREVPIEPRDDEVRETREEEAAQPPVGGMVEPWAGATHEIEPEGSREFRETEEGESGGEELVLDPQPELVEPWAGATHEIEPEPHVRRDEAGPGVSFSAADARPVETPSRTNRPLVMALLIIGLVAGAMGFFLVFFRSGTDPVRTPSTVTSDSRSPGVAPPPVQAERASRPVPAPAPTRRRAAPSASTIAGETAQPGHLTVPEFGVGRRVVRRRLEDLDEQFAEWDVVWFSTRVLGGGSGDTVRHVWLHEGRVMQTIELGLGGPDWRTHSRKTLGHPGQWAVEARDEEGRVLARSAFTCIPSGR